MRDRIAAFDWASTPVGPPTTWPPVLRTMVEVILDSRFPMMIFWGPELVQIYNDAYAPLCGRRHPQALGQRAHDCWPEVWDTVGPLLDRARSGTPVWAENAPFVLQRNGYPEQAYFTFCYSRLGDPVAGDGVLCCNVETTEAVAREYEFRAMANSIANIVYTHTPDGAIEWANTRWHEYTRLPEDVATNVEGWARVVPREDIDMILPILARAFTNGEPYEAEIRIKPADGGDDAYRWHLLRAVPMRATDGTIMRWAGSATDIHDRRMAEIATRERLEREFTREHETSVAFQRAALPQRLPRLPGLTFDAIYEAAGEGALVGGDWYDAFRLSDGRIVISVGDVIGSGLSAAVTMVATRQSIRGAAQVFPEPAAVLDAADRALRSEQPDRIVTTFLGILDPLTMTLTYASAGHPPPLLRLPTGAVVELEACDLPLGLRNDLPPAPATTAALPANSLLVLYTDGLTEVTRDVIEGDRRLRAAIARDDVFASPSPAAAIRRTVLDEVTDDVAILTLRVAAHAERETRWSFASIDAVTATFVRREIAAILRAAGATLAETGDAELVFGELIGNVVRHTNGDAVDVALDLTAGSPVLHVLDRGPGFTYYARLPKDSMSESGRGLFIATALAKDLSVTPRIEGGSHARAVLAVKLRGV